MLNDLFPEAMKFCDTLAGYKPEGGYLYWVLGGLVLVLWWLLIRQRRQLARSHREVADLKQQFRQNGEQWARAERERDEALKKLKALTVAMTEKEEQGPATETTLHDILALSARGHTEAYEAARLTCMAAVKTVEATSSEAFKALAASAADARHFMTEALEQLATAQGAAIKQQAVLHEQYLAVFRELSAEAVKQLYATAKLGYDDTAATHIAVDRLAVQVASLDEQLTGMAAWQQSTNPAIKLAGDTVPQSQPEGESDGDRQSEEHGPA